MQAFFVCNAQLIFIPMYPKHKAHQTNAAQNIGEVNAVLYTNT
jgi:hypothetical protein